MPQRERGLVEVELALDHLREEVLEDSGLRVDVQVTRRVAAHVALGVRRVQVRRQQQVAAQSSAESLRPVRRRSRRISRYYGYNSLKKVSLSISFMFDLYVINIILKDRSNNHPSYSTHPIYSNFYFHNFSLIFFTILSVSIP